MDTNNWRPNQGGDSFMESVDWRTLLPADSRQKIVNKIMDTLKKHIPSSGQEKLHEVKDIALRFEHKIYTAATSQSDYMRKISMKMLAMENRSANHSLQSNSAGNTINLSDSGSQGIQKVKSHGQPPSIPVPSNHHQTGTQILPPGSVISQSTIANMAGQSSSLQNIQNISGVQQGNNMGHGIPPGNLVSQNQRQIPGRQHYFYQKPQLQQIAKQNNSTNSVQSQSQIQKQHQNLLQPNQFQPSQQSVPLPTMLQPSSLSTLKQNQQTIVQQSGPQVTQQHQQSVLRQQRQQTNATNLQHNQLIGQPLSYSDMQQPHQHSVGQHNNFSSIHQQHLGQKQPQQQQQLLGTQSGNSTMLNNQHSGQILRSTQGQRLQQLQTQSAQLQHQLNIKQRLPTSGAFQSQNVIDQQKQLFQQQRAMPEASSTSSDSTAQTGNPNGGDWQEEVYQKMKAMKDKYMPDLNNMYRKVLAKLQQHDSLPQQQKNEQVEKLRKVKQFLENCMSLFQVPKSNISPKYKENLDLSEKQIVNFLSTDKHKPGTTPQHSLINSLHQSQQQTQARENQLNSQSQHNNIVNSVSNAKQNNLQPNSKMIPHQQLKQLQHLQMHQQFVHKQKLLHQHQFHQQTKHQQQNGQQIKAPFSPQVDQQNTMNSSGTPLQSGNAPFIVSSPFHMPGDTGKINSGHQTNGAMMPTQPLAIGTPGMSASPLLADFTTPDGNHVNGASLVSGKSGSIQDPMEHLLKVVKSISSKSLSASVSDIGSVVSMIDSIAGPTPGNGSRAIVGQDLVAMTKSCLQERTCVTHDGTREMKRLISQLPLNLVSSPSSVNDSFMHLNYMEASELESTATSTIKRPRIETRHPLLEEIREINQGLIDTVVNISEEDSDPVAASEIGKGTVVKCSFSAVALDPNLKSQYASAQMSSMQPLRLLVPTNYPTCSPILLDKFPLEVSKECEDLSIKAKLRFSSCVRRLSDPMSLEEMARTWDICARAVILEYAQQYGDGGTFSSKNGAWEDCLTAA